MTFTPVVRLEWDKAGYPTLVWASAYVWDRAAEKLAEAERRAYDAALENWSA